jgi:hypothetical protein
LDADAPAAIVLLSSDPNFAYATSILRMRNYRVIVVASQQSHKNFKHRASDILDWDALVVGKQHSGTHSRPTSDSTCLRPDSERSRTHSCTPSPSNSTISSPLPKPGRPASVKEERSPLSPSHIRNQSRPQNSTRDRDGASTASNLGNATSPLGSTVDDEEDLLFSVPPTSAPNKEDETLSSFSPSINIHVRAFRDASRMTDT